MSNFSLSKFRKFQKALFDNKAELNISGALKVDGVEIQTSGATTGQGLIFNGTKFTPQTVSSGAFNYKQSNNSVYPKWGDSSSVVATNAIDFGFENIIAGERSLSAGETNINCGYNSVSVGSGNFIGKKYIPVDVDFDNLTFSINGMYEDYFYPNDKVYLFSGGLLSDSGRISSVTYDEVNNKTIFGVYSLSTDQIDFVTFGVEGMYDANSVHAEGLNNSVYGTACHIEGSHNILTGNYGHIEGQENTGTTNNVHVEGANNFASGQYSHAEGYQVSATTTYAHAEGWLNLASGQHSHAQGKYTVAAGTSSHSGGRGAAAAKEVRASGTASFNHSEVTLAATGNIGAAAANSAILGGTNNQIQTTATKSVVLGGTNLNATIADTVYMSKLAVINFPVYADNAAALAGGLHIGVCYRTAAGDIKVVI